VSAHKREDYENCSVHYCVLKLCTVISTLRLGELSEKGAVGINALTVKELLQL